MFESLNDTSTRFIQIEKFEGPMVMFMDSIEHIKSSGDEHLFFADDDYVLRITDRNVDNLIRKSEQVQALPSVQKILFAGRSFSGSKYNYVVCSKRKGCDYIDMMISAITYQ